MNPRALLMLLCAVTAVEAQEPETFRRTHTVLGMMGVTFDDDTESTIGADYEYRLGPKLGAGGYLDLPLGNRDVVIGASGFVHPTERLAVLAGPGFEVRDDDLFAVLRVGGYYEFALGERWSLAPTLDLDVAAGRVALVAGVSLAGRFTAIRVERREAPPAAAARR